MEQSPPSEANSHSLVKKFTTFYGTGRFIIVFTRYHHLSLSWARCIQPKFSH